MSSNQMLLTTNWLITNDMKRTLIIALAFSISSFITAYPLTLNRGYNNVAESSGFNIYHINSRGSELKLMTKNDANNQVDKPDKSSVNEKKNSSQQKENKDGNYRDMQRGRKVLEHKYNLYA
jgi:hypothetical protein